MIYPKPYSIYLRGTIGPKRSEKQGSGQVKEPESVVKREKASTAPAKRSAPPEEVRSSGFGV